MRKSLWLAIISASALVVGACGTSHSDNTGSDGGVGSDLGNVNHGDGSTSDDDGSTSNGDGATNTGDAAVAVDLGPDDSTPDELTLEELPSAMAELFCDHLECFNMGEAFFFRLVTGDLTGDACRARVATVLANSELLIPRTAYEAGEISYDATAAQACFDSLRERTLTCNDLFGDNPDNCANDLFVGTTAVEDECVYRRTGFGDRTNTCVADATCVVYSGSEDLCPGVCVTMKAPGDECSVSQECAVGDEDDYSMCSSGDFVGNRCIVVRTDHTAEEGEQCDGSTTRDGFVDTRTGCVDGLFCIYDRDMSRSTCVAPAAEPSALGEPCNEAQACEAGLVCLDRTCGMFNVVTEVGEPCGISPSGFALCDIGGGLACELDLSKDELPTITGTCVTTAPGAEGSSCGGSIAAALGGASCDEGLYCQTVSDDIPGLAGTCQPLAADGEPCENSTMCASGNCSWDSTDSRSECMPVTCTPPV